MLAWSLLPLATVFAVIFFGRTVFLRLLARVGPGRIKQATWSLLAFAPPLLGWGIVLLKPGATYVNAAVSIGLSLNIVGVLTLLALGEVYKQMRAQQMQYVG